MNSSNIQNGLQIFKVIVTSPSAGSKPLTLCFPVKRAMFRQLRVYRSTTPLPLVAAGARVPLSAGVQLGTAFCEVARAAPQSLRNALVRGAAAVCLTSAWGHDPRSLLG